MNMKIVVVSSLPEGIKRAKEWLYTNVDVNSALFLSGGSTPRVLYESLAKEKKLRLGAVALVDERYGDPMHRNSNELMIRKTGLIDYIEENHIPWYGILHRGLSREKTANKYNRLVTDLANTFQEKIAIVSIGKDGHTGGIAPDRSDFQNPLFSLHSSYVASFHDTTGLFGQRISLTFEGLSLMDRYLLWVMGREKEEAFRKMFEVGTEEEIPARFYLRDSIKEKVHIITNRKINLPFLV